MERRDFFVSYNKDNKAWAEWIVRVLNDKGYSTYSQFDIKPGEIFLTKMNDFLENSANFIAVWSEGYSNSWYCMREIEAAFKACHERRMGCLLPVLIDSCPVKLLYSALVHVELSDRGAASEEALADALRRAVPRPAPEQEEDEDEADREKEGEWLYQLGENYFRGNKVKVNYKKARNYWEQAAEKGNAEALYGLGLLYESRFKDDAKAWDYWRQAAEKGHGSALYRLGLRYEYGYGVDIDYKRAIDYYQKAADVGHPLVAASIAALSKKI